MSIANRKEFVSKIENLLNEVAKNTNSDKNSVWTKLILKKMNVLAKQYKLEFWAHHHNKEWLYDATFWYDRGDEFGIFACAEIEWDKKDEGYHHDYKKVLSARTDIPIFITDADGEVDTKKQIEDRIKLAKIAYGNPQPVIFVFNNDNRKWYSNVN